MTKLDWHHVIHLAHFLGMTFLLALPVSSVLLWIAHDPKANLRVTTKLAEMLTGLDRLAQLGILILVISGIGQIWAHDIGPDEIFGQQIWLGIKIVLVAVLVADGIVFAGPALRRRVRLLHEVTAQGGIITPQQGAALEQGYRWTQITGSVMILLILAILVVTFFQPFTAHPK